MARDTSRNGFTLLEMLFATLMMAMVVITLSLMMNQAWKYYHRYELISQTNIDSQRCMDTIQRLLSNSVTSSIVIQSSTHYGPPTTGSPAGSEIFFSTSSAYGARQYDVFWSDNPPNSVHLNSTYDAVTSSATLATHITSLNFGWGANDASVLTISILAQVPLDGQLDAAGQPVHLYTADLPQRTVRVLRQ